MHVSTGVVFAAVLVACTSSSPGPRPPIPPAPAGHILIGTDVTDGHPWKAYRYKGEGGACITLVDEEDRQSGSSCGEQEMAFDFVKTTVWILPTSKEADQVRLEFGSKPPVSVKVRRVGAGWPYDYAVLLFPNKNFPSAIVELDSNEKELRRIPCDSTSGCRR